MYFTRKTTKGIPIPRKISKGHWAHKTFKKGRQIHKVVEKVWLYGIEKTAYFFTQF